MQMKHLLLLASLLTCMGAGAQQATFRNPVIAGDMADPTVIRVDNTYYATGTSSEWAPYYPLFRSKDLVNWTIIGAAVPYALPPVTDVRPEHGNRVWAPSIRHHNGEFYIFWGDPDQGAFMVKAKDPKGPWSEPVLVKAGKGIIDTTPLLSLIHISEPTRH